MRAIVILLVVCVVSSACGARRGGGRLVSDGGTDAARVDASLDSASGVVDDVTFDTMGCIGEGAPSESGACDDVAMPYVFTSSDASSSACMSSLSCTVSQRGCRIAVSCAPFPLICGDLDMATNSASTTIFYAGETYECQGAFSSTGSLVRPHLTCVSAAYSCFYQ